MKDSEKQNIINRLRAENYSCIIVKDGISHCFHQRGIRDLYILFNDKSHLLKDAFVADKVVGKGAAALMVLGGIADAHAEIISEGALKMLKDSGIICTFATEVTYILNRNGTGICPIEQRCLGCTTAKECLTQIKDFIDYLQD